MKILRPLITFTLVSCLVSCNLEEAFNENDPKNICGGISSSNIAPTPTSPLIENSVLHNGYIEFDLKVKVQNCTIQDLTNLDVSIVSAKNSTAVSASTPQIASLERNEKSDYISLGRYKVTTDKLSIDTLSFTLQSGSETWNKSLSVSYAKITPKFKVVAKNLSITSGSKFSDGDGVLDPGENFSFNFELQNLSITDISSLNVNLTSNSDKFTINSGSSISIGNITQYEVHTSATQTQVSVSDSASKGLSTNFSVAITDGHAQSWSSSLSFQVSSGGMARIRVQSLDLASGEQFAGFGTYNGMWFIAVDSSTGVKFYKKEPYASSWTLDCTYSTGTHYRNLAVDASYYYIGKSGGIDRVTRGTCSNTYNFTPSSISSYSDDFNTISYNNGIGTFNLTHSNGTLHYRGSSNDFRTVPVTFTGTIYYWDMNNLHDPEVMFASTTSSSGGNILGLEYVSYKKYRMNFWYDSTLENKTSYLHYTNFPTSTYPDLLNTKAFFLLYGGSGKDIVVATQSDSGGTIKFYPLYFNNPYPNYCDSRWPHCYYHSTYQANTSELTTTI